MSLLIVFFVETRSLLTEFFSLDIILDSVVTVVDSVGIEKVCFSQLSTLSSYTEQFHLVQQILEARPEGEYNEAQR